MNAVTAHARVDTQPARGLDASADRAAAGGSVPLPKWVHPNWHVAQTHPQAERWAIQNLTRQGYVAYLPLLTVRRRDRVLRTMWHSVEVPLFPGYIFVRLGYAERWSPIQSTQGVARLIVAGGKPAHVPPGLVEALQAGEDARRSVGGAGTQWAPGMACALATGPFREQDAVVIAVETDRVVVGVMCFGAVRQLRVAADCLIPRNKWRLG